jgi:hypothetical protein
LSLNTQRFLIIFVDMSSTEFVQNLVKNVYIADKLIYALKYALHYIHFHTTSNGWTMLTWRLLVSNFVGIGQEVGKVCVEFIDARK